MSEDAGKTGRGDKRERWKTALATTKFCSSIEELSRWTNGSLPAPESSRVSAHVADCYHCQAELAMLKGFESGVPRPEEATDIDWITARLADRLQPGATRVPASASRPAALEEQRGWWPVFFGRRPLSAAALAFASVLLVISATLYLRNSREPSLSRDAVEGPAVLRSEGLTVAGPVGDLEQAPVELRWQPVPRAMIYAVQIMEVDRATLWTAESREITIRVPAAVQAKFVPGKTLLWQVKAVDAAGKQLAASQVHRFRVLVNPAHSKR